VDEQTRLAQLAERAIRGDREALVEALRMVSRRLTGIAYGICLDQGLAEDAVQDAYIKALSSITRLRQPQAFLNWIERIVVRTSIDAARWHGRELAVESIPETSVEAADPIATITILKALELLPPQQRAVIVLFYWLDAPLEQIADLLSCELGTVKSRLARGRQALGELLEVNSANA
jgi:RNA polymerase sigma-70 factor, ECF subfamily